MKAKITSVLLAIALLCSVTVTASAATTQAEIDALKEQKSELAGQRSGLQSQINGLRSEQNSMMEMKAALDLKNELTLMQILNLGEQIDLHEELIAQKTLEVEAAQAQADEQRERYLARVRAMEENGKFNYLEVIFGAGSISEFLSLVDDISSIMQADKELEQSYRDAVSELETVKAEYEQAQLDLKERKAELVQLSDQLQRDIDEADGIIVSLQSDIGANSALLAQLNAQHEELEKQISDKVKELQQQNKPKPEPGGSSGGGTSGGGSGTGTGSLIWPSYCLYITSRQGPRVDPVTGEIGRGHGGTDIGASYGSAIYAADGGTVIKSGYEEGGYGNYIMIDHGNEMQTLYAHMSAKSVSVGDKVSQGQTIGLVGSTGRSTGPHLHYELYVNGSRVDPQSYYSGMSFSYAPDA